MDRSLRNALLNATQALRRTLEADYADQIEGTFDLRAKGSFSPDPPAQLDARARRLRERLVAAIRHMPEGKKDGEKLRAWVRLAAFTTVNRLAALKLLEARGLVKPSVSDGTESVGFREFTALAPGLKTEPDAAYRLYLESLFDEISVEVGVLFDRNASGSLLWPSRRAFREVLETLNDPELAPAWGEDETIGWIYQYFNSQEERQDIRREARSGPRNSRELAILNQFFTPRYVVEFLTENTLARTWWEMTGGETALAETCAYLMVRPTDEPRERAMKDPRDLKVLDPASGSGHFLLYSYDLLEAIYREAWERGDGPVSEATGRTLREDYPEWSDLAHQVPVLILAHNLWGVDIDPRAAQIASFALWLRAQRSFHEQGIEPRGRPRVRRTNLVVAEPMPGEAELKEEFFDSLDAELRPLAERVFQLMELAGEAGTLLRIEVEIREAVREELKGHGALFSDQDETRWTRAEARLLHALEAYASQAGQAAFARRLFADDAAHGLAFIDLCRTRFDVVLMNPPFGSASVKSREYLRSAYGTISKNVIGGFLQRTLELTHSCGIVGVLCDRTIIEKSSYHQLRTELLLNHKSHLAELVDLGWGVLDRANVATCAITLVQEDEPTYARFVDLQGVDPELHSIELVRSIATENFSQIEWLEFSKVPNAAIAHWAPPAVLDVFRELPPIDPSFGDARVGIQAGDTFRAFRLRWEVPASDIASRRVLILQNGGRFSPYYFDTPYVLVYRNGFGEYEPLSGSRIQNVDYTGRAGISWGERSDILYGYPMAHGQAFTNEGHALFPHDEGTTGALVAILNSKVYQYLINLYCGQHKLSGYVGKLPVSPALIEDPQIKELGRNAARLALNMTTTDPTTGRFITPLRFGDVEGSSRLEEVCDRSYEHIKMLSNDLEEVVHNLEGRILDGLGLSGVREVVSPDGDERPRYCLSNFSELKDTGAYHNRGEQTASLLEWIVGVAVGRFDIRLATGERPILEDPDPFAPIPACSPGMLQGKEGLPATTSPPGYPLEIAWDGVLVDDEGHARDIVRHVRRVLGVISDGHDWAAEAEEILGRDLRSWVRRSLFEDHIKRYSKSRRKAPIFWRLGTPSGSYSVWLYYPRTTGDTLYRILNDYLEPKLRHEESALLRLQQEGGNSPTAGQQRAIESQETLVAEIQDMKGELEILAQLWKPDFDDGVVLNFAPFWRLVGHTRSWQRECQKHWEKLQEGEYDWSYTAMRLWPERVVPACATDRSFAIAHGLEEEFFAEGDGGRGTTQVRDNARIQQLVDDRTSTSVKQALQAIQHRP